MRIRFSTLLIGLGFAAALFIAAGSAQATLGEREDSVASDEGTLSGKRVSATVANSFRVKQIDADSVSVREYISPTGVVFAITWRGLIHPDLIPLLGTYAKEYESALQRAARRPGRRRLHVETNRVVVEKWGQMRNLQGRAYIPALIPAGVTIDEIK